MSAPTDSRPWFAKKAFKQRGYWLSEGWTKKDILQNTMAEFDKPVVAHEKSAAPAESVDGLVGTLMKQARAKYGERALTAGCDTGLGGARAGRRKVCGRRLGILQPQGPNAVELAGISFRITPSTEPEAITFNWVCEGRRVVA